VRPIDIILSRRKTVREYATFDERVMRWREKLTGMFVARNTVEAVSTYRIRAMRAEGLRRAVPEATWAEVWDATGSIEAVEDFGRRHELDYIVEHEPSP